MIDSDVFSSPYQLLIFVLPAEQKKLNEIQKEKKTSPFVSASLHSSYLQVSFERAHFGKENCLKIIPDTERTIYSSGLLWRMMKKPYKAHEALLPHISLCRTKLKKKKYKKVLK